MAEKKKQVVLRPTHIVVFDFIQNYTKEHVVSPTLPEIREGTNLTERTVWNLIEDLIQLKYLGKVSYRPRGLKILRDIRS